jgi:hypothetical protein
VIVLPWFKVEGREAEVIGDSCNELGIKVLQLTEPSGPVYHYNPPSKDSFGDQPLLGKWETAEVDFTLRYRGL